MFVAALAGLVLTSGCTASHVEREAEAIPDFGTVLDAPVPVGVLTAPLTDIHGRPTTLGDFRGKVIVISDVMTLCQESCPLITAGMVAAARELTRSPSSDRVEFVSITIDPTRDDVRHLRAYGRQFGALPNWTLLTGTPSVVDGLWHTLGVWRHRTRSDPPYPRDWLTGAALTSDIAHTDELIFIDGQQTFRYEMDGYGNVPPASVPSRIYHFMDPLGHRNAASPDPGSFTPQQVGIVIDWLLGRST
ncbi:MAG: SCO family protein [Nocardioidaceae bacterium]